MMMDGTSTICMRGEAAHRPLLDVVDDALAGSTAGRMSEATEAKVANARIGARRPLQLAVISASGVTLLRESCLQSRRHRTSFRWRDSWNSKASR